MQQFKFVNWRIRGFVFWCHEQVCKSLDLLSSCNLARFWTSPTSFNLCDEEASEEANETLSSSRAYDESLEILDIFRVKCLWEILVQAISIRIKPTFDEVWLFFICGFIDGEYFTIEWSPIFLFHEIFILRDI